MTRVILNNCSAQVMPKKCGSIPLGSATFRAVQTVVDNGRCRGSLAGPDQGSAASAMSSRLP